MRAIDADALIEKCGDWYVEEGTESGFIGTLENLLATQPTIHPEIIRCKDCKHWIPYEWMFSEVWQSKNIADYPEDDIGCDCCEMAMKANDFCSRAERRTE